MPAGCSANDLFKSPPGLALVLAQIVRDDRATGNVENVTMRSTEHVTWRPGDLSRHHHTIGAHRLGQGSTLPLQLSERAASAELGALGNFISLADDDVRVAVLGGGPLQRILEGTLNPEESGARRAGFLSSLAQERIDPQGNLPRLLFGASRTFVLTRCPLEGDSIEFGEAVWPLELAVDVNVLVAGECRFTVGRDPDFYPPIAPALRFGTGGRNGETASAQADFNPLNASHERELHPAAQFAVHGGGTFFAEELQETRCLALAGSVHVRMPNQKYLCCWQAAACVIRQTTR